MLCLNDEVCWANVHVMWYDGNCVAQTRVYNLCDNCDFSAKAQRGVDLPHLPPRVYSPHIAASTLQNYKRLDGDNVLIRMILLS